MRADLKRRLRALELRGAKSATTPALDLSTVDYSALSNADLAELEALVCRIDDKASSTEARFHRLTPDDRKRLQALIDLVIFNQPDQRPAPAAGSTEQIS
jgi:hypothetical protein